MHNARSLQLANLLRLALLAGIAALVWIGLGASAATAAPALISDSPAEILEPVTVAPVSAPVELPVEVEPKPADIALAPASPITTTVPLEAVPQPVAPVSVAPTNAVIDAVEPVLAAPASVVPAKVLTAPAPLATVVEPVVAPLESIVVKAVDPVGTVSEAVETLKSVPTAALHGASSAPDPNSLSKARVSIPAPTNPTVSIDVAGAQMADFNVPFVDAALSAADIAETNADLMPLTERQAALVFGGPTHPGGLPGSPAASSSLHSVASGGQGSAGWLPDTSHVYSPAFGTVPDSSWLLPASLTSDPGSSPD